jgi:hypothetical protein
MGCIGSKQHLLVSPRKFRRRADVPRLPEAIDEHVTNSPEPDRGADTERHESVQSAFSMSCSIGWVNWILFEIHPYIRVAMKQRFETLILPRMQESVNESPLRAFGQLELVNFDLGESPAIVGPLTCYKKTAQEKKQSGIQMDVMFDLDSALNIDLRVGVVSSGLRRLRVKGVVCVVLEPLLDSLPVIGGVQLYGMNDFEIMYEFAGVAGAGVDAPIISSILAKVVRENMRRIAVLPRRCYVPLCNSLLHNVDLTEMKHALPCAVLRLQVLSCVNLPAADIDCFGRPAASDPYVTVYVGVEKQKTTMVKKSLNPTWDDAVFEFLVHDLLQRVRIEVHDSDFTWKHDDFLGGFEVTVNELVETGNQFWKLDVNSNGAPPSHHCEEGLPAIRLLPTLLELEDDLEGLRVITSAHGFNSRATYYLS